MKMLRKDLIEKVLKILKKTSQVEFILVRPTVYRLHIYCKQTLQPILFGRCSKILPVLREHFGKVHGCNSVLI